MRALIGQTKKNDASDVYSILAGHFVKWDRIDSKHIKIYTEGYVGLECMQIQKALKLVDAKIIKLQYMPKWSKTCMIIRLPL